MGTTWNRGDYAYFWKVKSTLENMIRQMSEMNMKLQQNIQASRIIF